MSKQNRTQPQEFTATELFAVLNDPGSIALFVDDGGTPGQPVAIIPKDFQILAGFLVRTDIYQHVSHAAAKALHKLVPIGTEFHTTAIVSPERGSEFASVSVPDRIGLLRSWTRLLADHALAIPYCQIGAVQYEQGLRDPRVRIPAPKQPRGLQRAFYTSTIQWYRNEFDKSCFRPRLIVVEDERGKKTLCAEPKFKPQAGVFRDAIYYMPSGSLVGLQLADLCAYLLNWIHHAAYREAAGSPGRFDAPLSEIYATLHGLLVRVCARKHEERK